MILSICDISIFLCMSTIKLYYEYIKMINLPHTCSLSSFMSCQWPEIKYFKSTKNIQCIYICVPVTILS